jgi:tripartite-type tricarboxylate transporter receptor subunit TctC
MRHSVIGARRGSQPSCPPRFRTNRFVAPPGVPADRVAALRDAFEATMKDPEFLADTKRQRLNVDPIRGSDIDGLLARVEKTPPAILERVTDLLGSGK